MFAQELFVDTIANNLANVNTTGFKKSRVEFQDLLYQTLRAAGTPTGTATQVPTEMQIGYGTRPVAIQKLFSQGNVTTTGNPLDIDIQGEGFFQIHRPE
jgi:flagellar basal-body rod protein FlgG